MAKHKIASEDEALVDYKEGQQARGSESEDSDIEEAEAVLVTSGPSVCTPIAATGALTPKEKEMLAACEEKIAKGVDTFIEVGDAFYTIKTGRLYRAKYGTFENYCEQKWKMSRQQGHRYVNAGEVNKQMSAVDDIVRLTSLNQSRALEKLPKDKRVAALKAAQGLAGNRPVETKDIKQVVAKVVPESTPPKSKPAKVNNADEQAGGENHTEESGTTTTQPTGNVASILPDFGVSFKQMHNWARTINDNITDPEKVELAVKPAEKLLNALRSLAIWEEEEQQAAA